MGGIARSRAVRVAGLILVYLCALFGFAGIALARSSQALQMVRYRGVSVHVPRSWPVFDLAQDPQACVRFDRHAVYLGTPGRQERCPAHAVGRTDAILISPLHPGRGAPTATASGLALEGDVSSYSLPRAGVEVTATWTRTPQMVAQALGRSSLAMANGSAAKSSAGTSAGAVPAGTPQRSSFRASTFTGLGFDTCAAPSRSQMSAWRSSPYHGVGIYIGGVNMACAQVNLTKGWVSREIASGWHPFPLWVGPQAPSNECGCRAMSANQAQAKHQGAAAASTAVAQLQRLGILPGNPIYYDMEGYVTGGSNTAAVLAFLAGWTFRLHNDGYISGVYSSASTGINDLVDRYHSKYPEPNDISIADWNGQKNGHDPYVPAGEWSHHQRLHQYLGNQEETYGGVRLSLDDDFMNGATANARNGYMLLTSNGGIHLFGPIRGHGSDVGKFPHGVTAVALARDRKTGGYWILRSDGGIKGFNAPFHGSLRGKLHGSRPVALDGSPAGGYLVLTSNGGVHGFGPIARHGGDAGKLSRRVKAIGLARDRKTGGYWILRSTGRVDSFNAPSYGGIKHMLGGARPVALAAAQRGGYFILTSNGAVHHFGPAKFYGSATGKLPAGVRAVSLATSPTTAGYRILRSDGGVNCFGAIWYGSLAGQLPTGSSPLTIANASS
jgi:Rv2525c-like, glycoside hydrolase-like domain